MTLARLNLETHLCHDTADAIAGQNDVIDTLLQDFEIRLLFEQRPDRATIQRPISLGAGRRTAAPLLALSVRKWMPAASIARAITPPSASTSRVR